MHTIFKLSVTLQLSPFPFIWLQLNHVISRSAAFSSDFTVKSSLSTNIWRTNGNIINIASYIYVIYKHITRVNVI